VYDPESDRHRVRVSRDLQWDFSLHQPLSLFLADALEVLDPETPDYALDVLTLVEAILDDPLAVLRQQAEKTRRTLLARLKAEGVPYEERLRRLDEVRVHLRGLRSLRAEPSLGRPGEHPAQVGRSRDV
jgi:hypothetical protein